MIGDAIMIRVPDAAQAVRLALRLTREVGGRHGFPAVRVGLHTGPAVQRGNDWFGSTVNLAARVSNVALAGEVLATDAARNAAVDSATDLEFRSRGQQRFKNVAQPVAIFVVGPRGEVTAEELDIDPVCQMAVDPRRAGARRTRSGRGYTFCSEACATSFDATTGSELARRASRGELRASDDARARADRILRRAYRKGRFDVQDLEERSAHVQAARTRAELRTVLRDLPEYRRWRARMRRRRLWVWLLPRGLRRRLQS